MDMAHTHTTQFCPIIDSNELHKLENVTKTATVMDSREHSSLRLVMDSSVWEVICKEVMDWRDPSWTSMDLPEAKTCMDRPFLGSQRNGRRH